MLLCNTPISHTFNLTLVQRIKVAKFSFKLCVKVKIKIYRTPKQEYHSSEVKFLSRCWKLCLSINLSNANANVEFISKLSQTLSLTKLLKHNFLFNHMACQKLSEFILWLSKREKAQHSKFIKRFPFIILNENNFQF